MPISMYQASAPRFAAMLKNLSNILDKAQAHCEAKKIDPARPEAYFNEGILGQEFRAKSGGAPRDTIAKLLRFFAPASWGDGAVAQLTGARPFDLPQMRSDMLIVDTGIVSMHQVLEKVGRTTSVTRGVVQGIGTYFYAHAPGGMNVRVDSGLYAGYKVPPYYDSMIAKLIVYGTTRAGAMRRLRRALEEFVIEGMQTTIPLHRALIEDPEFQAGEYTIKWLEEWLSRDSG